MDMPVVVSSTQLPATKEELTKYVLFNEERLQALRAEIRAANKIGVAKQQYCQRLKEAQELGELTILAAQKLGEILLQIDKASGGNHGNQYSKSSEEGEKRSGKTKAQITSEMGLTRTKVSEFQKMAQHPEAIEEAFRNAIDKDEIVSRAAVMKIIKASSRTQDSNKDRGASSEHEQAEESSLSVREMELRLKGYEEIISNLRSSNAALQADLDEARAQNDELNNSIKFVVEQYNDLLVEYEKAITALCKIFGTPESNDNTGEVVESEEEELIPA